MASPNEPQAPAGGQAPAPQQPQGGGRGSRSGSSSTGSGRRSWWSTASSRSLPNIAGHRRIRPSARHVKRLDGPDKVTGRARLHVRHQSTPACSTAASSGRPIRTRGSCRSTCRPRRRRRASRRRSCGETPLTPSGTPSCFKATRSPAVAADTEERAIDAARLVKVESWVTRRQ